MEIDLNADVGEGFGPWRMGDDGALLDVISSANIACGYHAGDPVIMDATVRLAAEKQIDIGAHVGFPDLMGFGRRQIDANPLELATYVLYQLGALAGIAKAAGQKLTHMSFHGALGNMAAADILLAEPLVRAAATDHAVNLAPWPVSIQSPIPQVHVMAQGKYSLMITSAGFINGK